MTSNVVQFPKGKLNAPPQSIEEMVAGIDKLRHEHADEIVESMIPQIIGLFTLNGVDIDSHEYVKDVSMIVESSKALLYKYFNIDHAFHPMIQTLFDFHYNEDDTISYFFTMPTEPEEEL